MGFPVALTQLVTFALQGIGLLAIVAVVTGSLRRTTPDPLQQSLILGALFGLSTLLFSVLEQRVPAGFVLDGRFMCVALAAAFGGPAALAVAATLSAIGQGWPTDIAGVIDVLGPLLIGLVALGWRGLIRPRFDRPVTALLLLGLMLAPPLGLLHDFSGMGMHPPMLVFWGGTVVISVLVALVVGLFLEREKGILAREELLLQDSLRDPLTGLHNRRSFDAELARVLASPGEHYLLYADVDHFKRVNDRYGHSFGDEALRAIARTMLLCVRRNDIVARLGGEEFGIILADISREEAQRLADRLIAAVAAFDHRAAEERITITLSVGAARRRADHSPTMLMSIADMALYEAKNSGRRRAVFCTEPMAEPTQPPDTAKGAPKAEVTV
ncbi:diguanylate cyclase (GGDEF)-like protein [Cereibacter changlensis]|uniref:diguanylate cyclase n=3 Tax=Cereibacter changlensis TaxID=402884 RepID=A0A2W7RG10_9RHOB|nr:GGDEF domain-containing protein [Cereibacter changlensis]PZX57340.1 diguanylate cyclase (GGDEF)-like protein [Cereibacter changlensis]